MSVSGKEIINVNSDEDINAERQNKHKVDDFGYEYSRKSGKTKWFVLSPFKKAKNKVLRSNNVGKISSLSSPGKRIAGNYFCFREPETMESCIDPNDPKFTFDVLRAFLGNNDFYSEECNPHLDFIGASATATD